MIFTSALFFLLALSSSFAEYDQGEVDQLMGEVSTRLAEDMARVAQESSGQNTVELNNKLLISLSAELKQLAPQLQQLYTISKKIGGSVEALSNNLALMINENNALNDALSRHAEVTPRALGALAIGIVQIITDATKLMLTRY